MHDKLHSKFLNKYMLTKLLALIMGCVTNFSGVSVSATPAIPLSFQLFTAVSLIYSMSQLCAHQAAIVRKF